jgi:hypothetical protein
MGIFDFLKPKNKADNKSLQEKAPIEPNALNEFDLKLADFDIKTHSAKVISVKVSADFYELFPEAGQPGKPGEKLELKTYVVNIFLWGQTVEVAFDAKVITNNLEDFIKKINKQLNWLVNNKDLINGVIIRDLLQLKNDTWSDEDQPPVGEEDFLKSIRLTSADFIRNAAFNLYYDDCDLFGDHTITVAISAKCEVKKADIAG